MDDGAGVAIVAEAARLIEADLVGGELYELRSGIGEAALPMVDAMAELLDPLGVARGDNTARGGAGLKSLREANMPCSTGGARYSRSILVQFIAEAVRGLHEPHGNSVRAWG